MGSLFLKFRTVERFQQFQLDCFAFFDTISSFNPFFYSWPFLSFLLISLAFFLGAGENVVTALFFCWLVPFAVRFAPVFLFPLFCLSAFHGFNNSVLEATVYQPVRYVFTLLSPCWGFYRDSIFCFGKPHFYGGQLLPADVLLLGGKSARFFLPRFLPIPLLLVFSLFSGLLPLVNGPPPFFGFFSAFLLGIWCPVLLLFPSVLFFSPPPQNLSNPFFQHPTDHPPPNFFVTCSPQKSQKPPSLIFFFGRTNLFFHPPVFPPAFTASFFF